MPLRRSPFGCLAVSTLILAIAGCSSDDNQPDEQDAARDGAADVSLHPDGGGGAGGNGGFGADSGTSEATPDGAGGSTGPLDGAPTETGVEGGTLGCAADVTSGGKAKNVIFFLGDGMGIPVLTAARIYAVGEEGTLAIDRLPETGFVRTYSKSHMVTDSAPSMSAYMTGVKMDNDVLAMSADTVADQSKCVGTSGYKADSGVTQNGGPVTTFLELAKKAGKGTGVVTTTRVTHATPAATYSHICQRDLEGDIAAQSVPGGAGYNTALGDGIDVVLGGGFNFYNKAKRSDGRDLLQELRDHSYTVVQTASDFGAFDPASGKKLFGVFTNSHMSYNVDRVKTVPPVEPSLAEMTTKAIEVLAKNPKGFFLMVEGGRIDHALHETHARRALEETLAFDKAISEALKRVDLEDTLVVVTADHDHTMIHNGYAHRVGKTTEANAGIVGLVRNVEWAPDAGGPAPSLDRDGVPYTILGFTNGPNRVSGKRVATGFASIENDAGAALPLDDSLVSGIDYRQESTFRMSLPDSETHGGTDVSIWATGASSEQVHGFMTNTEVFGLLRCGSGL